jgi:hypothetical protein
MAGMCTQAVSWWLEHGPEASVAVLQTHLLAAFNHYPNSFFSLLNVFLCITTDYDDASYGTADQCTHWFNPHLKKYMAYDLSEPEPVGAQHWHGLSQFYIKGRFWQLAIMSSY